MSDIEELSIALQNLKPNLREFETKNYLTKSLSKMPVTPKDITTVYQDTIPVFDGDTSTLNAYIAACEFLITTFLYEQNDVVQALLLRIFQGKLRGKALQTVSSNEICGTWTELKALIINSFGDQRSESCLFNDLVSIKPARNESAYDLGKRIKSMLQLLLTQVKLHDVNLASRTLKSSNYKNTALQIYLQGLLELDNFIGILVQVKQPVDLEAAMSSVIEVENFNYRAGRSNNLFKNQHKPSSKTQTQTQQNKIATPFRATYSVPHFANPIPHTYAAVQDNTSGQRNVFASRPNTQFPRPEPMNIDRSIAKRQASNQMSLLNRQKKGNNMYYTEEDCDDEENNEQLAEIYDIPCENNDNDITTDDTEENFHIVCLVEKKT